MSVIESRELVKSYGKIHALNNLSFTIEENTITGLIGRNGAGKTTLLKLIAGYLRPTKGKLQVFSQYPFNNLYISGNTIFVDDNMAFPDSFTLVDILREIAPFYPNWDGELANGLFDYFGLNPIQRHSSLSKGSKSTLNAIIGISARCPLTLLDEPTTGMDSAVRKDFYRALLKDYIEHPRTIILSSHLLEELEEILENILLLDQGTQRLHLPILELKEYAIGLRGNTQAIVDLVEDKDILYKEEFAKDSIYAVVKTEGLRKDYERIRQNGVEVIPVSIDDLCIHLTAKTKGGIDDVFKRG
jgi:ABC-2 type transport system ATP-binding protein